MGFHLRRNKPLITYNLQTKAKNYHRYLKTIILNRVSIWTLIIVKWKPPSLRELTPY